MKSRIALAFLSAILVVSCEQVTDTPADPNLDPELAAFNALADIPLAEPSDFVAVARLINELNGIPEDREVLWRLPDEAAQLLADEWDDPRFELDLPADFMEYRAWLRCRSEAEEDEGCTVVIEPIVGVTGTGGLNLIIIKTLHLHCLEDIEQPH